MNQQTWWPAPAKINLFLHVTGRRSDGYHTLQTLFQFLDYSDQLSFAVRRDGLIRRLSNPELPDVDLSVRAACLLQDAARTPLGVDIRIQKNIPSGAGLGGGSSDAATTLVILNRLWRTRMTIHDLSDLAAQLGADVPVFVHGRSAWAEGIGDELTPYDPPKCWYCVIFPTINVKTAEIFADEELTRDSPIIKIRDFPEGGFRNDLEAVTCRCYPQVADAVKWLGQFGAVRMTGSGAAVFVPVVDRGAGQQILLGIPRGFQGFVAKSVNRHPLNQFEPVS